MLDIFLSAKYYSGTLHLIAAFLIGEVEGHFYVHHHKFISAQSS